MDTKYVSRYEKRKKDVGKYHALLRIVLLAIATFVCFGVQKDIVAAEEPLVTDAQRAVWRGEHQQAVDLLAGQVAQLCAVHNRDFSSVYLGMLTLIGKVIQQRNKAYEDKIIPIVKQCNGLLRKAYMCLAEHLISELQVLSPTGASDKRRQTLRKTVQAMTPIPESYLNMLINAERLKMQTSNFNIKREEREGVARRMYAHLLDAAKAYNTALQAEAGDKFQEFGFDLPGALVQRAEHVIQEPVVAPVISPVVGAGPGAQEADEEAFRRQLQQQDPKIYDMYVGFQKKLLSVFNWPSLYVATFKPKQEELFLGTEDNPVPTDYAFAAMQEGSIIRGDIEQLDEDRFGAQERLARALEAAQEEFTKNTEIWRQAVGFSVEQPVEVSQAASAFLNGPASISGLENAIRRYFFFPNDDDFKEIKHYESLFEQAIGGLTGQDKQNYSVHVKIGRYENLKKDINHIREQRLQRIGEQMAEAMREFKATTPSEVGGISGAGSRPVVGELTEQAFVQKLAVARERLNELQQAIDKASAIARSSVDMNEMEREAGALERAYSHARNFILTLVRQSQGDERAANLENESQAGIFKTYEALHDRMWEIINEEEFRETRERTERGGPREERGPTPEPGKTVGVLSEEKFEQRIQEAERSITMLHNAIVQAEKISDVRKMPASINSLQALNADARNKIERLLEDSGRVTRAEQLERDSRAVFIRFEQISQRMEAAIAQARTKEEQREAETREQRQPVVPPSVPEEETVGTLTRREYERQLAEVIRLQKELDNTLQASRGIDVNDIKAMEAMLARIRSQYRLALFEASSLHKESGKRSDVLALAHNIGAGALHKEKSAEMRRLEKAIEDAQKRAGQK